jgi:hypothetical protein
MKRIQPFAPRRFGKYTPAELRYCAKLWRLMHHDAEDQARALERRADAQDRGAAREQQT